MNDRLAALRLFARVARTGSFSAAGRELGLSQPSASRRIAELEREVGATLLTRTTRAVTLTEAGARYLDRIDAIAAALDEADQEARGTGELRGTLRVAAPTSFALRELIPRLPRFTSRHTELRFELSINDRPQDMLAEGLDVALRVGPQSATLHGQRIAAWPQVIAASPAYVAQHGMPQTPSELSAHATIALPHGVAPGWTFTKGSQTETVRLESRLVISVNEGRVAAAVAGLGLLFSGRLACTREFADGRLVRVLPDWYMGEIEMHALFPTGQTPKPSARAFVAFLRKELQVDGNAQS